FRLAPIFVAYALEQRLNRECFETRLDNAGVKTRDIQQRAEQIVHGAYRAVDMVDQSLCFNIHRPGAQRADEHAQRMDRLAQIVTCGREEARFCQVRLMSQIALVAQLADEVDIFKTQPQRFDQRGVDATRKQGYEDQINDAEQGNRIMRGVAL